MNNKGTKEQSLEGDIPDWKRVHISPDVERLASLVVDSAFALLLSVPRSREEWST
jgi:hypothetical protein